MAKRIEALDGLRGLAALHVCLRHFSYCYGIPFHPVVAAALVPFRYNAPGHALFFVLSGFGLTLSLMRQQESGNPPRLGPYLATQWRRVGPAYYAALLLYCLVPVLEVADSRLVVRVVAPESRAVVGHLLFAQGLIDGTAWEISPPLWSLALIFQFYLLAPLLFVLMERFGYRRAILGVAVFWLALRVLLKAVAMGGPSPASPGNILCHPLPFVLGMGIARWYQGFRRGRPALPTRVTAVAAFVMLGGSVAAGVVRVGIEAEILRSAGFAALLMAVLVSAGRGGASARLLACPLLGWLGSISYGLYLTHDLVLSRLGAVYRVLLPVSGLGSDALLVALAVALTVSFAWLFHRLLARVLHGCRAVRVTAGRLAVRASTDAGRVLNARPVRPM
jgi:peptidoglycan/LPS O-acetylase OafA/YrhL